jgi:hypothetical protein
MKGESKEMIRIEVVRTPEARFEDLPDYPFTPHYVEVDAGDGAGTRLRVHYLDERPNDIQAGSERVVADHRGGGCPWPGRGPARGDCWAVEATDHLIG